MRLALLPLFLAVPTIAAPAQITPLNDCLQPGYQCSFKAPPSAVDKHVRIVVDAQFSGAKVWLNGDLIGENKSGIAPFEFDLTPALKIGATNKLDLHLNKSAVLKRVYLLTTGRVFPVKQSVVASPRRIALSVLVRNTLDNTAGVQVNFAVSIGGKVVGSGSANASVPPNLAQSVDAVIALRPEDVQLWDPDHPNLYLLRSVITKSAEAVEGGYESELESAFGIRTVEIRNAQFLLNGEPLRLGGAHPAGDPAEEELRFMKEAGMVFQMVDHPLSTATLDWADRNGLLLIERAEMRKRDAEHPSVVAWTAATPTDAEDAKRLDPTRPVSTVDFSIATAATLDGAPTGKPIFLDAISGPEGTAALLRNNLPVFGAAAAVAADSRWAEQFRLVRIQAIYQKNGNTFIEVRNSDRFPSQIARDYEVRVGPLTQRLPMLNPGQIATLEFEHVNPYRVDVCEPTGFVVDSR